MNIMELSPEQVAFSYEGKEIVKYRGQKNPEKVIGQPRGLKALKLGMMLDYKGYNIFVSGDYGTGRHSAIKQIASELPFKPLNDLVFAYCFLRPQTPESLLFPAGTGNLFKQEMDKVANFVENNEKDKALSLVKDLSQKEYPVKVLSYLHQVENDLKKETSISEKYRINLVVNNENKKNRPLVFESHPDHANIFGYLSGISDYTHLNIIPGSLFDALGGFFVVDANQIIQNEQLWEDIKRFAYSSTLIMRRYRDSYGNKEKFIKVALDFPTKIILVGSDDVFEKLSDNDESFLSIFRISAQFDFSMEANEQNLKGTISYIENQAKKSNLLPLTDDTIASLLNYSAWLVEDRKELTTQMSLLAALLFEADLIARNNDATKIESYHVNQAIQERNYNNGIIEERINKEITKGDMIISLSGSRIGIVNGLAVIDRGQDSFGTPTVISATVAPGSEGIVNIEHEAGLSGEIHDKGLLILEGYLRKRYARTFPLSIYAGICFEQSYAEVDGDSASSSELFALLSAIGEIPIRQDIAVTGSVNQTGKIQPVGGINEKISGFFKVCMQEGLTGSQGVIIPKQNISSLILSEDIIKSIKEKKFHIYPIETIDQGMEILTHRPSGERNPKGVFPPETLNRIIEVRLKRLFEFSKSAN